MLHFSFGFICTLLCLWGILNTFSRHCYISGDINLKSPQKFHDRIVPRVGGFGIVASCLIIMLVHMVIQQLNNIYQPYAQLTHLSGQYIFWLVLSSLPIIWIGFIEDILKDTKPHNRLLLTALSAALFIAFTGLYIPNTNIQWLDNYLNIFVLIALTIFGVTGIVNAVNIIDGFNGLASMFFVFILISMLFVMNINYNNPALNSIITLLIGCNIAFLLFNYPKGKLFLGDAGAYFMGFALAEIIIMMICFESDLSAWYGVTLMIYPITEVLFSIHRKKFVRKSSPFVPDGLHLHMLIYKRIVPKGPQWPKPEAKIKRNMLTSPVLWILSLFGIIPATLFAQNTLYLQISCGFFVITYIIFYRLIVSFRVQNKFPFKWLRRYANSTT